MTFAGSAIPYTVATPLCPTQQPAMTPQPPQVPVGGSAQRTEASCQTTTRDEQRRAQQRAENELLQQREPHTLPRIMSLDDMLNDCVWIGTGGLVGLRSDPGFLLRFAEFKDFTAASHTKEVGSDGRKRRVLVAVTWQQDPGRHTVMTRTFHAGAPVICRDPDGRLALNLWRQIERWPASQDITPFLQQLAYLFSNSADLDTFLDWLAHLEQRPGELPHFGFLFIAKHMGTGRNWLASLLARLWRGYVAPSVHLAKLLESSFNGQLAGRVLAIVDEAREGGSRHAHILRSLVNEDVRNVNPKCDREYREHNALRWLVFSNHLDALPFDDTDRRWWVVRHTAAPREPEVYTALYALLRDPEFVNAVGWFLRNRDISAFNPGQRPPMNDAKMAAVGASMTMLQQDAADLVKNWPADVVTNADAAAVMSEGIAATFSGDMARALLDLGAVRLPGTIYFKGKSHRAWILRDAGRWKGASAASLASEAVRAWQNANASVSALDVLRPPGSKCQLPIL